MQIGRKCQILISLVNFQKWKADIIHILTLPYHEEGIPPLSFNSTKTANAREPKFFIYSIHLLVIRKMYFEQCGQKGGSMPKILTKGLFWRFLQISISSIVRPRK